MSKQQVGKGAVLTLRISEGEQEQLRLAAERKNKSVSEYVRGVVRDDIERPTHVTLASDVGQSTTTQGFQGGWMSSDHVAGAAWISNGPAETVTGQTLTISSPEA